jgi:hypothetical protein
VRKRHDALAIAAGKIEHGDSVDFKEPWSAWHEVMAVGKWFCVGILDTAHDRPSSESWNLSVLKK